MKTCKHFYAFFIGLVWAVLITVPAAANKLPAINHRGLDKQLLLDLATVDGNIETLVDGMLVRFNNGYLASTADDAEKLVRTGENIASYREGKDLEQEKRPLFYATDTIFLHITNTVIRNYRFKISMQQFGITGLMARLDDIYLNTSRVLDTYGGTADIDFNVTGDPASANPFRFKIVFITATPLPVTITHFTAMQQGENIVLQWKVSNEVNIVQYEIERSADGIHFVSQAIQVAASNTGSVTYNWQDEKPAVAANFYRIRCVGRGGYINYSDVVAVKLIKPAEGISLYPNPVINGIFSLQFSGMVKGIYQLIILNSKGQILFTKPINNNVNTNTQTIVPGNCMPTGNYYLQIMTPDEGKITKQLMVVGSGL